MDIDLSVPTVRDPVDARQADRPCWTQVGNVGGEPVMFLHDPERIDRLNSELETWPWG